MINFKLTCFLLVLGLAFTTDALPAPVDTAQQFLSLADLHFDPFLSCQQKPCALIQTLQAAPVEKWSAIFSRTDTAVTAYGKDSNYALIESAIAAAKKQAEAAQIQFVLVLGDFLAHDYHKKYAQYSTDKTSAGYILFVKKTMAFLARQLNQAFPHTDIYWAVGNNDSYQADYSVDPGGLFFQDLSHLAMDLIKNKNNRGQFLQTFPAGGYYAVNAPGQPALRLIFLNSVLFSTKARGHALEPAALTQLTWLHDELSKAAQKQQHVLIAMHIPTGIDVYTTFFVPFSIIEFWKAPYTDRFLAEIKQASTHIIGVFSGHIHADTFQILTGPAQPIVFTGTPSISPIFGNNPAFKIYSYASPDVRLIDFVTYYFSLNSKNTWEKEYDFDDVYQLKHSNSGIINGLLKLQPTGELANRYKTYYVANGDSQPITQHSSSFPSYWCATREFTPAGYRSCLSSI